MDKRPRSSITRRWRALWLGVVVIVPSTLAAAPALDPQPPANLSWEAVKRHTADLQGQVARLAEMVGGHLGDESLGPNDVKAIIEALALQRAVEVFASLVATHSRKARHDLLGRSLPLIEEHLQRTEAALAEASNLQDKEALEPPSSAHPVSIRSTLADIRKSLGLTPKPAESPPETLGPPSSLGYLGPSRRTTSSKSSSSTCSGSVWQPSRWAAGSVTVIFGPETAPTHSNRTPWPTSDAPSSTSCSQPAIF